ncbi:MAG: hypothetical protein NTV39_04385 [Candidatus Saccharibacteria bacterium]|nr:hypothetical protein [Candidatus Saccharibacteria bacterium]
MDETQPQTTKPISDDQELAKVLAGVTQESNNMDYEDTPATTTSQVAAAPVAPPVTPPEPITPAAPATTFDTDDSVQPVIAPATGEFDEIKKDALSELRPLVDKLDLAPDEKFDTYLLLIRSTDDKTLVAPAHEAAKSIPDETKRAQALLDIIKEIDYLSSPDQPSI